MLSFLLFSYFFFCLAFFESSCIVSITFFFSLCINTFPFVSLASYFSCDRFVVVFHPVKVCTLNRFFKCCHVLAGKSMPTRACGNWAKIVFLGSKEDHTVCTENTLISNWSTFLLTIVVNNTVHTVHIECHLSLLSLKV